MEQQRTITYKTPAYLTPPVKFDALWCSKDSRVRVATIGPKHYVSIDGDNFCGPHKTAQAARDYGAAIAKATKEAA